jgi:hypothetical protein
MRKTLFSLTVLTTLLFGCNEATQSPEPLTLDQIPAAMAKAFQNARPAVRQHADGVVASLNQKNYPAASVQLTTLTGVPELTDEQRSVANRSMVAVNEKLQEIVAPPEQQPDSSGRSKPASAAPNPQDAAAAAAAMEHYRRTK